MDAKPTVFLIGDINHREFAECLNWLSIHTHLVPAGTVDQALQQVVSQQCHYVLFALSRPGQVSAADVQRMSRRFPLAHLIAILGSLCEGEPVPRTPEPGVTRVYWHQFLARCRREISFESVASSWQLPRTAAEAERTEVAMNGHTANATGLVAIFSRSAMLYDGLAAACQQAGYSSLRSSPGARTGFRGAVAGVWDGVTQGNVQFQQLEGICQRWPQLPVIALLAFPRHDQVDKARQCGARTVLSSPFLLPDLWHALEEAGAETSRFA